MRLKVLLPSFIILTDPKDLLSEDPVFSGRED